MIIPFHPEEASVIDFLNQLVKQAIQQAASDIHIEPQEKHCRLRFRCDGLLREITTIPHTLATKLIARLKVMAKLDIAEKRLPQDGRVTLEQVTLSDIRISTCPTLFGEKTVLRLLDTKKTTLNLNALGLLPAQQTLLQKILAKPQGLILVTGPTGSGKTVTLYSALHSLNSAEKNISTVEDPVEIQLPGINQVNIHPKAGLHFTTVLRALLRQDPDILMIGEIRDAETANIAVQAAQTGHLVLSTLHTNSAIETLRRLQSLNIATHHLVHAVSLIIAQRLVRVRCPHCIPTENCPHCHQGYLGRTGIFELLPMTATLAELILANASPRELQQQAEQEGFLSLKQVATQKVAAKITTLDEIQRVIP